MGGGEGLCGAVERGGGIGIGNIWLAARVLTVEHWPSERRRTGADVALDADFVFSSVFAS